MIVMCHVGSSAVTKVMTLAGDADGEAMHGGGRGIYGNSLYLPLNFAVNLKQQKKWLLKK